MENKYVIRHKPSGKLLRLFNMQFSSLHIADDNARIWETDCETQARWVVNQKSDTNRSFSFGITSSYPSHTFTVNDLEVVNLATCSLLRPVPADTIKAPIGMQTNEQLARRIQECLPMGWLVGVDDRCVLIHNAAIGKQQAFPRETWENEEGTALYDLARLIVRNIKNGMYDFASIATADEMQKAKNQVAYATKHDLKFLCKVTKVLPDGWYAEIRGTLVYFINRKIPESTLVYDRAHLEMMHPDELSNLIKRQTGQVTEYLQGKEAKPVEFTYDEERLVTLIQTYVPPLFEVTVNGKDIKQCKAHPIFRQKEWARIKEDIKRMLPVGYVADVNDDHVTIAIEGNEQVYGQYTRKVWDQLDEANRRNIVLLMVGVLKIRGTVN